MSDDRHHFEITVRMRGAGADWDTVLAPQEVRAYNLSQALRDAADNIALAAWFPEEDE